MSFIIGSVGAGTAAVAASVVVSGSTQGDFDTALAAAAPGAMVVVPGHVTLTCTGTVTIDKRITLTGGGTFNFTSGVTNAPGIDVIADGCVIDNIRVINPNALGSATGTRNTGIRISANDAKIVNCHVEKWQSGIAVRAGGEYAHHIIANNRVKDTLGAGGGPSSVESIGEDRGDGITTWGTACTITGNVVNALAGTDARVGIHAEALIVGNVAVPPHTDTLCTISGNVVYGQFRRGIVTEDVHRVAITGNTVCDSTWWSICLLDAWDSTVTGNTILWTRTSSDNQGGNFSPIRAPLCIYRNVQNSVVSNNTVRVTATGNAACYILATYGTATEGMPTDVTISGNTCTLDTGGVVVDGIRSDQSTVRLRVLNNTIRGFTTRGFQGFGADACEVRGNDIDGIAVAGSSIGIKVSDDPAPKDSVVIADNRIRNCVKGIERSGGLRSRISGNYIEGCTSGIDGFGCTVTLVTGNSVQTSGANKIYNITDGVNSNVVTGNLTS